MVVRPPGTILQRLYLKERLSRRAPGRFVEIGPGQGDITGLLLDAGWQGVAYELDAVSADTLRRRFADEILKGRLTIVHADYMGISPGADADLVISCMVLEHLDDDEEARFLRVAAANLRSNGYMIGLVPGAPSHWGIEDDIAGHKRRYSRDGLEGMLMRGGWRMLHVTGLTFPISNLLLPLSNFLVARAERKKLALSQHARTQLSGRRRVMFKTHFPAVLGLLFNELMLRPFHWLQKRYSSSAHCLVLYFEAQPERLPDEDGHG